MPSTLIEIRQSYSADEEVAIIDAVQASLVAAFRIPPGDRHVRLHVNLPHRMATSPNLEHPDRYTLVTVDCFSGRSEDAKRELYEQIVTRLEPLGIPRDHVTIIVRDLPARNWGIRGGKAASDIDLGFKVEV